MSFSKEITSESWQDAYGLIYSATQEDARRALAKPDKNVNDFAVLLSPAAESLLSEMAHESQRLTLQRFGKNIQLYVPVYLSNECHNVCTYCGFSRDNEIPRKTLSSQEIKDEVKVLKEMGFDHVLLVTGEAKATVGVDYIEKAIHQLRNDFAQISIEVQPLEQDEYERLSKAGMSAVYVYQETYHKEEYKKHHPKGKKSIYNYRLDTPDRLGKAGVKKVGIGVLLGLEDWRVDSFFCALHLDYLEKKYWQTKYSLSFPRLRPHAGGLEPKVEITDRQFVQLLCAWRLFNQEVELSVSTREAPEFRDGLIGLGVTSMSAASKTEPGGYANEEAGELEQFSVDDLRSAQEVATAIKEKGYQAVWKDWDESYD